jgi:hypothetical protein
MLQEGFFDVVSKAEIALRTVGALKKGNYNESVVEDGVLYLQVSGLRLLIAMFTDPLNRLLLANGLTMSKTLAPIFRISCRNRVRSGMKIHELDS